MLVLIYIYFYVCGAVLDADVPGIPDYQGGTSHTEDWHTEDTARGTDFYPWRESTTLTDNHSHSPGLADLEHK